MTQISQADADARHVKRSDYESCTVAFIDCKKPGHFALMEAPECVAEAILQGLDAVLPDTEKESRTFDTSNDPTHAA